MTPSVALSRSADRITSAGFLPPSSAITGRGTARAALSRSIFMPDLFRAGEDDAIDAGIVDELLAGGAAAAGDEVEHAVGHAGLADHLGEPVAHERRGRSPA